MERFQDPGNRLFELARQAARPTRWWVVPLLLFLFSLAGAPGSFIPLESAADAGLWWSAAESVGFLTAAYIPVLLLVLLWIWRRERRRPSSLGLSPRGAVQYSLYGFGFGAGMIGLGVALLATSGNTSFTFDQTSTTGWIALAPGLAVLGGWIVQGFTEEIMFRGWMLQNSGAQLGPIIGTSVSVFLFALAHIGNPGITPLGTLNLALIGILFTLIALLEGGIWAASGFHIAWNWAQSNIFGFNVSGLEIGGGSLVQVVPTREGITGGEFGFEGSVAATTTIVIGILIVLALGSRQERVVRS
ncbi:MAG: type II CAAX endopeptidase family protein [Thermomicrobiales bacterium]